MNINKYINKYVEVKLSYVGVVTLRGIVFFNHIINNKHYGNICLIDDRGCITNLDSLLNIINEHDELSMTIHELPINKNIDLKNELKLIKINEKFNEVNKIINSLDKELNNIIK